MPCKGPSRISGKNPDMIRFILCCSLILLADCQTAVQESSNARPVAPEYDNHPKIPMHKGYSGIVHLKEMLCYVQSDSCNPENRTQNISRCMQQLYQGIQRFNMIPDGPLGQILLYKDSIRERFELFKPIQSLPQQNPQQGQLVFLESGDFYVFHHYGNYRKLAEVYTKISLDLKEKKLQLAGPVREIYLVSLEQTEDSSRWITQLLIPVKNEIQE